MKSKEYPSREFFESRMSYDPETGSFTWLPLQGKRITSKGDFNAVWNAKFAGKPVGSICKPQGYLAVTLSGGTFRLHRVAMIMSGLEIPEGMEVDHINRKVDDNRLCNLRIASPSDNSKNALKKNKMGYSGVTRTKKGYTAFRITDRNGKRQTMYGPQDPAEAAVCRDAWNIRENGDFAATNFPRSLYYLVVKSGPHGIPPY